MPRESRIVPLYLLVWPSPSLLLPLVCALPGSPAARRVSFLARVSPPSLWPVSFALFLLSSAFLLAQAGLPPSPLASPWWGLVLGSRVAWGDSERLECGKGGVGWGSGELWGAEGGFSLGWSEFSHLAGVQATGPCQADDITLQECPLLLAQEARLEGGAPSGFSSPALPSPPSLPPPNPRPYPL